MNFFLSFCISPAKQKSVTLKMLKEGCSGSICFHIYANNGMVQTSLRSPAVHWDRFCLITLTTIQLTLFFFFFYVMCWIIGTFGFSLSSFSKPHIFYFVLHCHGLSVQDYLYLYRREFVI